MSESCKCCEENKQTACCCNTDACKCAEQCACGDCCASIGLEVFLFKGIRSF